MHTTLEVYHLCLQGLPPFQWSTSGLNATHYGQVWNWLTRCPRFRGWIIHNISVLIIKTVSLIQGCPLQGCRSHYGWYSYGRTGFVQHWFHTSKVQSWNYECVLVIEMPVSGESSRSLPEVSTQPTWVLWHHEIWSEKSPETSYSQTPPRFYDMLCMPSLVPNFANRFFSHSYRVWK